MYRVKSSDWDMDFLEYTTSWYIKCIIKLVIYSQVPIRKSTIKRNACEGYYISYKSAMESNKLLFESSRKKIVMVKFVRIKFCMCMYKQ